MKRLAIAAGLQVRKPGRPKKIALVVVAQAPAAIPAPVQEVAPAAVPAPLQGLQAVAPVAESKCVAIPQAAVPLQDAAKDRVESAKPECAKSTEASAGAAKLEARPSEAATVAVPEAQKVLGFLNAPRSVKVVKTPSSFPSLMSTPPRRQASRPSSTPLGRAAAKAKVEMESKAETVSDLAEVREDPWGCVERARGALEKTSADTIRLTRKIDTAMALLSPAQLRVFAKRWAEAESEMRLEQACLEAKCTGAAAK